MNSIVIYSSKNGSTKEYAELISKELTAKAISIKEIDKQTLENADCLIYGGNIMGGKISNLNKFLKLVTYQKVFIFGVGMSAYSDEYLKKLKSDNLKGVDYPLFYLRGAIDQNKLGFMSKKMVNMVLTPLRKKVDDPVALDMIDMFDNNRSYVSKDNIKTLIEAIKK